MANISEHSPHNLHIRYANTVFKNALNALLFINDEGKILEANPASCILLERPIDEINNHCLYDLISNEKSKILELFIKSFINGLEKDFILSFYNKKGESKVFSISGSANIDQQLHFIILKDISSNAKTETQLADSEQRLNAIIETGQECIKLLGNEGEILEINAAGLEILEANNEKDVIGKSVFEVLHNKYKDPFKKITAEVFQGQSGRLEYEITGLKGTHHWIEMKAAPLFCKDKKTVIAMLSISQKITERKKAENALLESEKMFTNIFEFSPIPLLISRTHDGKVIMANQGIEKMMGKSKSQIIGEYTSDYYARKEDRELIISEMMHKGEIIGKEIDIKGAGGQIRSMLVSIQFIVLHGENMLLTAFIDITERKQKDKIIESTKNDLASIVNMLPDLLFRFNEENKFIFYHTNDPEKLITSPDLFLGKTPEEVLPQDLAVLVNKKIHQTRASKQLEIFEYSLDHFGETEWFECRMLNTENKEVLAIIRNITPQKQGELAIKESEYKFRSLVKDLTVGVFVQDKNQKIILHNDSALDLLGVDESQLINTISNTNGWEIKHEDGSLFRKEDFPTNKSFESLKPCKNVTIGLLNPLKKDMVWLSVDAIPMIDQEGKLIHIVCTLYDISIKKKAEDALHKSEDNLRTVFQNTEVGYILFDRNRRILSFNENAQLFTQKDLHKNLLEGAYLLDYTAKEREQELILITQKVLQGESIEYDMTIPISEQEKKWFRLKYSPVYNKTQLVSGFVLSIEDITQRKNNELELINSLSLVTEQNERLLNFSYIVSHNLRSHTSNIKMILNLLEDEENEDERKELLESLKSVSELLNETIYNLNDVISIQSNINKILEPIKLNEYINKALEILSKNIKDKNVTIKNNITKEIIIQYNPAYLESIILNFISNAIKYSDPKKEAWIEINVYEENDKTVLLIKDNGIGIDLTKNGDKLFGMYKTFHGNSDARGLGLFISKNQIESMGGHVDVESELNKGTSFKITLG